MVFLQIMKEINLLITSCFALIIAGCGESPTSARKMDSFAAEIAAFRKDFLAKMTQIEYYPLKTKAEWDGIRYFDPDPAYRFPAKFECLPAAEPVLVRTTDGSLLPLEKHGLVTFQRQGQEPKSLIVFKRVGFPFYFISFYDSTNGKTTYGGGRNLDFDPAKVNEDGTMELDFNQCYNPWCHYSNAFPCPLPPADNRLNFPVNAGEKCYLPPAKKWSDGEME